MRRREFMMTGAAAAVSLTAAGIAGAHQSTPGAKQTEGEPSRLKLKYAPHAGHFTAHAGDDHVDQIRFSAEVGFRAWEDNDMPKRSPAEQERIGKALADHGMEMGVFVAWANFGDDNFATNTGREFQDELRKHMTAMLDVAKRCGAKWCTVVPNRLSQRMELDYQMANCIENLKVMAEVCEPTGLVMVLEPLNAWADHPGLLLTKVPQAYLICKAVDSPSCKILDDLYHQQITEGNLIPNLDKAWSEIAYIQVGDNPGRREPYTGEINYNGVFKHLHAKGYTGIVGMEHGKSQGGKEGELKLIEAYRRADDF